MNAYILLLRARHDADPAFAPRRSEGRLWDFGRESRLIED